MNYLLSKKIKYFKIKNRGGQCVPVQVDHENSEQIENLFKQINKDENGQLDILVNNAYKGVNVFKHF